METKGFRRRIFGRTKYSHRHQSSRKWTANHQRNHTERLVQLISPRKQPWTQIPLSIESNIDHLRVRDAWDYLLQTMPGPLQNTFQDFGDIQHSLPNYVPTLNVDRRLPVSHGHQSHSSGYTFCDSSWTLVFWHAVNISHWLPARA